MCNLSSVKTIARDVTDLSPYGLSDPVELTAVTDSGDSYQLLVGNPTPTNESYYAMLPGTTTVYTIDYTSGSVFRANKNTLKTGICWMHTARRSRNSPWSGTAS